MLFYLLPRSSRNGHRVGFCACSSDKKSMATGGTPPISPGRGARGHARRLPGERAESPTAARLRRMRRTVASVGDFGQEVPEELSAAPEGSARFTGDSSRMHDAERGAVLREYARLGPPAVPERPCLRAPEELAPQGQPLARRRCDGRRPRAVRATRRRRRCCRPR